MNKIINGIQQIGIGVADAKEVFNWYRVHLGFDILVFEDEATADLMVAYTGGKPVARFAMLSLNMSGGGGLEIWQAKNKEPRAGSFPVQLGDLGINVMKIRSRAIHRAHARLKLLNLQLLTDVVRTPEGRFHFYFRDPWENIVEVVSDTYVYSDRDKISGGVLGVVTGVKDMDLSLRFYREVLGYDTMVYDLEGAFPGFSGLPGAAHRFRRVLLRHSQKAVGGFGELFGPSEIELLQVLDREPLKVYRDRHWGDLGYIHLCFDISGMQQLSEDCSQLGYPFTVDSRESFDMGEASGHFGYVEDPDGTLIEFVETHRVPIFKPLGLSINLKKRDPGRPLPKWMVNALKLRKISS
ncbi:VOC family protein [Zeaxanthinibacter sp. PT1]|uniref:VOC family protein n=1 Tax=Zeaxanthinibacter TaxID=561554 RepID=UPI00234B60A2|nr:VOC family protein [Zeaxanthinibacter sp. PT1]MDC6352267.1 VOC family protein [Zeaxanthinibacter sp. PT1]